MSNQQDIERKRNRRRISRQNPAKPFIQEMLLAIMIGWNELGREAF